MLSFRGLITYGFGMLILLSIVFLLSSTVGCDSGEFRQKNELRVSVASRQAVRDLRFIKDKRSGLCFAVLSGNRQGYLAHVPCDKVKGLLE